MLLFKGLIRGAVSGLAATGVAFANGEMLAPGPAQASGATKASGILRPGTAANRGRDLFMLNCAHCHGTDARGDEGPDLHGLTRSDARIALMIKNGVKGEMPKFGAKLTAADVRALIAFVRSLKD